MRPIRTSTAVVQYVQPEIAAEGNGLSRLVVEMHCRARFRIVETERHPRSDADEVFYPRLLSHKIFPRAKPLAEYAVIYHVTGFRSIHEILVQKHF